MKLQDFEFLVYLFKRILLFLKQNFSEGSVLKVSDFFGLIMFDWPHSCDPYYRWEQEGERYIIFRILRDVLEHSYLCFWFLF